MHNAIGNYVRILVNLILRFFYKVNFMFYDSIILISYFTANGISRVSGLARYRKFHGGSCKNTVSDIPDNACLI